VRVKWKRGTTWLLLLLAWASLAIWQLGEYRRLRSSAFAELHRESYAVNKALIGGIRTHRGMGRLFDENLQEAIDDVVESETVVSVAIETEDGVRLASAGKEELLNADEETRRRAFVYAFFDKFEMQSQTGAPHGGQGSGGFGREHNPGWARGGAGEIDSEPATEITFHTILLLDATLTEMRCQREARLRGLVLAAGTLVLICVALTWRSTLRAAESHGRTLLLEGEARHLRDLSHAAAGLAHETRNPLGLIRGWTQRLDECCLDSEEHHERAQSIMEECDRVTSRINQFLTFARSPKPRLETVSVREIVDELATLLEPIFDAKQLSIDVQSIPSDLVIQADREMFRQAIFNLLQNAVQFSPQGGVVEVVTARSDSGDVRIETLDRGPGVPKDAVESLFIPYFTTRPNGAGLGLAIVRRIAASHGWQVGYNPRSGGGAVFWLDQIDG